VDFSSAQKFLVADTYKLCHNIALKIINKALLRRCKFRSRTPSFWSRDASARYASAQHTGLYFPNYGEKN